MTPNKSYVRWLADLGNEDVPLVGPNLAKDEISVK